MRGKMKTTAAPLLAPSDNASAHTTPGRARWRWAALSLALAAAPLAQAQTLMDTLQTVNISSTLDQQNTSSGAAALDRARKAGQNLNAQTTQSGAAQDAANQTADRLAAGQQNATNDSMTVHFDVCTLTPQFCVDGKPISTTSGGSAPATTSAAATAPAPVATPPAAVAPAQPFSPAQQARLDTAKALLSQGKPREARPIFEGLIAANYQQPEPHFGLALSLLALDDLTGAKFELGQFVSLSPTSFEGPYNLGVIAVRSQDYDEALKQFTAAASLSAQANPVSRRQVLDALATEQERRKDYAALSTTLQDALATDPASTQLKYRLGQAVALSGNGAGALPLLYPALQDASTRAGAALLIADIYAAQNLPDRAVRELDMAAGNVSSAERAQLLTRKAQLLYAQKLTKPAVQSAQEAVRADSRNTAAAAALGELLAADNDLTGSLAAWRKAAQLDTKNPIIRLNLAAVYLALKQYSDARSSAALTFKLADSADSTTLARAGFVQGVAAYRLGDFAAADSALSASMARQPSADTSLWLGLSRYALKDYSGAITALSDSLRLQDSPSTRLNLGAALLAAGRFAEAEPHLRAAAVSDPGNAAAWYQLGLSRKAQGKDAQAQTAFASAAKLGYEAAKNELK